MTVPDAVLPVPVRDLLDGSDLAGKTATTVLLGTTAADGWPHLAMLSPGEVLAPDRRTVLLALYPSSGTCRALQDSGRGLLSLVTGGSAYRIRIRSRRADVPAADGDALFLTRVEQVTEDRVPYADVISGITYRLHDPDTALDRWADKHRQLRGLL